MGLVGADRHWSIGLGLAVGAAESAAGACGPRPMGHVVGRLFQSQRRGNHAILEGIRGAKRTILVHAYLLYSTRLAGGWCMPTSGASRSTSFLMPPRSRIIPAVPAVARLVAAGIAVSLDARHAWAHDKVMILDGENVITGSSNWTVAAERNTSENLLVIRDPRLARVYTENWRRHAHYSTPYRPTVPWWARIRVVWVPLTRRRRKRWDSDMGEDG
jgi:PLD-like domain